MPRLDAEFVRQALGAGQMGPAPQEAFCGVSTDSRSIEPGQLFVALKGPNFNGHRFVAQALAKGAAAALVQEGFALEREPDACLLMVKDTLRGLGDLAGAWRREHSALVAAVTGSNGKTTTKEMLASILAERHRVLKNQGNFNNLIGLPLTLLQLSQDHTACVVEMGMSQKGEIARLTEIAGPEVGIVTNVGPAHIGLLGSLQAISQAKAELYQGLSPASWAVVNLDDPLLAPWTLNLPCKVITFGLNPKAQVLASDLSVSPKGQEFTLVLPQGDPIRVSLAVTGRHNVQNALAAAAGAWALGQGTEAIAKGLAGFRPIKGRLIPVPAAGGALIIDDTYNANPASLAAGLDTLQTLAQGRRMALILGDMLELGDAAPDLHLKAGEAAAKAGCESILALGKQAGQVATGARRAGLKDDRAVAFDSWERLAQKAQEIFGVDDIVLVKGSRGMAMERIVAALCQTGEKA